MRKNVCLFCVNLCEWLELIRFIDKSKLEFYGKIYNCENRIIDLYRHLVKYFKNLSQLTCI